MTAVIYSNRPYVSRHTGFAEVDNYTTAKCFWSWQRQSGGLANEGKYINHLPHRSSPHFMGCPASTTSSCKRQRPVCHSVQLLTGAALPSIDASWNCSPTAWRHTPVLVIRATSDTHPVSSSSSVVWKHMHIVNPWSDSWHNLAAFPSTSMMPISRQHNHDRAVRRVFKKEVTICQLHKLA